MIAGSVLSAGASGIAESDRFFRLNGPFGPFAFPAVDLFRFLIIADPSKPGYT
jgi:hypothetical protein